MMIRRTALAAALSAAAAPLLVGATAGDALAQEAGLSAARYRRMTLMLGTLALRTSEVALERASNAEVEEFATFEIDEQATAAQAITGREDPPPVRLTREQEQVIARLRALSGSRFDREYVLVQIEGHEALLRVQEAYLRGGGGRLLVAIAKLVASRVREHLDDLAELRELVGA